jgi:hypothetical protein
MLMYPLVCVLCKQVYHERFEVLMAVKMTDDIVLGCAFMWTRLLSIHFILHSVTLILASVSPTKTVLSVQ